MRETGAVVLRVLTAAHGADDGAIDDANEPPQRDRLRWHRGGSFVNVPHAATHPPGSQTGGQAVLPRRFRSSALRACGAGRLANGIPGQHAQNAARNIVTVTAPIGRTGAGSYPQFVVMVHDATSAWEVALSMRGLHRRLVRILWWRGGRGLPPLSRSVAATGALRPVCRRQSQ